MQWVIENWILLALGGAMVAMHLFGHGGHGGHGGHDGHGKGRRPGQDDAPGKRPKTKPDPKLSAAAIPGTGVEKPTRAAFDLPKAREKPDDP